MDFVGGSNSNLLPKNLNLHYKGESTIELIFYILLGHEYEKGSEPNLPFQIEEENKKFEEYLPDFKIIKASNNLFQIKGSHILYNNLYTSIFPEVITPPPKR